LADDWSLLRRSEANKPIPGLSLGLKKAAEIQVMGWNSRAYFLTGGLFFFMGVPQHSKSMVAQPQSSTTETTSPQALQPNLAPLRVTAFLAGLTAFTVLTALIGFAALAGVAFLAGAFLATAMAFTS
jgi:hypothetical protein